MESIFHPGRFSTQAIIKALEVGEREGKEGGEREGGEGGRVGRVKVYI